MKILIGAMLVMSVVAAQPAAAAGPWHSFGGGRFDVQAQRERPGELQRQPPGGFQRQPPGGFQRQPPGGFQRQPPGGFQRQPQRDYRREAPPERGQRSDGRMTDEERRNLNRDLDRANREIYKDKGRQR